MEVKPGSVGIENAKKLFEGVADAAKLSISVFSDGKIGFGDLFTLLLYNEPQVVCKVTAGQLIKKKNKFSINDDENIALREINERRTSIKRTHF